MKFVKRFKTEQEYNNYFGSDKFILPNVSLVDEENSVKYNPLPDPTNGYEFVDLGLPSGLKWATCNIGAKEPYESGLYFAWGETKGYNVTKGDVIDEQNGIYSAVITNADGSETTKVFAQDKSDYELYDSESGTYTKYSDTSVLTLLQDDDACYLEDKDMRMPTKEEFEELLANTTSEWTEDYNGSGVKGTILTSTSNGNSIFVPAVGGVVEGMLCVFGAGGYLFSSSLNSSGVDNAFYGCFLSGGTTDVGDVVRFLGNPLRAVQD